MNKKATAVYSLIKQTVEKTKCTVLSNDAPNAELRFAAAEPAVSELCFKFEPKRSLITLNAVLAIEVEPENQRDFAVLVCVLNDGIPNGSFDCAGRRVRFRITSCLINKTGGEDVIVNMINKAIGTARANFNTLRDAAKGLNFVADYSPPAEAEVEYTESDVKKFRTLCSAMDKLDWNYKKNEDALSVSFDVLCEDIPMSFIFSIDSRAKNLVMLSPLPFAVTDESFYNVAYAASAVSGQLYDGTFCYNMARRELLFKMNMSYFEGDIDEEVFMYMVSCSISTVEHFNDKFFELNRGRFTVESFLKNMYGF